VVVVDTRSSGGSDMTRVLGGNKLPGDYSEECAFCGRMIGKGDNPCRCIPRGASDARLKVRKEPIDLNTCDGINCTLKSPLIHKRWCRFYSERITIPPPMDEFERERRKIARDNMKLQIEVNRALKGGKT
jgi:hypothetical protein